MHKNFPSLILSVIILTWVAVVEAQEAVDIAPVPPPAQVAQATETADSQNKSFWDMTTLSGSGAVSYTYNINRPLGAAAANTFRVFDTRHNSFDFNLFELGVSIEPADWLKFVTVLAAGQDMPGIQGIFSGDHVGILDAYAEITAPAGNGVTFKVGNWETIIGYEVIQMPHNNTISRSINFGFSIPFKHTGILISYPFSSMVSGSIGLVNGWDNIADNNAGKTVLGQLAVQPMENLSLSLQGAIGPEQAGSDGNFRGVLDFVLNWDLTEQVSVGFNADFGKEEGIGGDGIFNWLGMVGYLHFRPTDLYGVSLRGEWFNEDVAAAAGVRSGLAATGQRLSTYEGTLTSHIYFAEGWDLRFEYRHDHSPQFIFPLSTGATRKFQDTVAAALTYAF